MAQTNTMDVTFPGDTEILITRTVNAPRHLVYRAWTTPELVRKWWPGRRGEMTVADMDFRVGGGWRYVMTAHGEFEVAFHGTYREIVPNERIVHTEIMEMQGSAPDSEDGAVVNTVTFEDAHDGGATVVSIRTDAGSKEVRDMIAQSGMEGGVREQFEIIEELAASLT
ncbi:SRPBCC family protein [Pseudarthrobacter sp. BIM B-2242]|uniref:SRPBCC family protein n=1 Tax=Pseudarthrobacter sp. BIM B-2242 TaxID=2772401 RepID=UPI00168B6F5B|nr:SRPBCC family protein [Pseudarthrobacter sp. BIM B-2242]QOD02588.1 SRPBCC family protein [Pseudarthrobacter sp. BIM B-2242]